MRKLYDVVIIGAGLAGLMAARALQGSGLAYVVIDLKKELGLPLKCAEGIVADKFTELFGNERFEFIRNIAKRHEIIFEDLRRTIRVNIYQLDRPIFEKWLGRDLNIEFGCACNGIIVKKDCAEIHTDKGVLEGRIVIICCGADFSIQKRLGLVEDDPLLAVAYGGLYKDYDLDPETFYYYFNREFFGYLWVFPKSKDIANIGFVAFHNAAVLREKIPAVLDKVLKENNLAPRRISRYGALIPCSGPIRKTFSDRVLACGDAAGFLFAGMGEGIYYALKSGRFAALTALEAIRRGKYDANFLKEYEGRWKRSFGKNMEAGLLFRNIHLYAHQHNLLKHIFNALSEREIKEFVMNGAMPLKIKIAQTVLPPRPQKVPIP